MAHRDLPPWNQVTHNPGSTGCPKSFQFREALVGFQGREFVDGVQPDFGHSLLIEALIFQWS
jgi:hypothetical protein